MLKTKPKYLEALEKKTFHKLIIGAALKDYKSIEEFAYLFTQAQADVIDISAFPHSIISAQKGIEKVKSEDPELEMPLIMVSVNIGSDPHFRRIELDKEKCTECLQCIPSCPSEAFDYNSSFNYNIDLCFGCSNCLDFCPEDALEFSNWSAFDSKSLNELNQLGANAIEIHLNNDLEAFKDFYQSFNTKFELESFCIGSMQMSELELQEAALCIVGEVNKKHGKNKAFIIQCDGIPISGARDLAILEKDLASIKSAKTILDCLELNHPDRKNIFVQLAGGITEQSLQKAHSMGVNISGVAIGSYARKLLHSCDSSKQKNIAISLIKDSISGTRISSY